MSVRWVKRNVNGEYNIEDVVEELNDTINELCDIRKKLNVSLVKISILEKQIENKDFSEELLSLIKEVLNEK